jgi:hypothetical protein
LYRLIFNKRKGAIMKEWYYLKDKEKVGPLSIEEIQGLIKSNEITSNSKVWKKGLKAWEDISKIDDFKSFFSSASKKTPKPEDSSSDDFPDETISNISDSDKTYSMIMYLTTPCCCWIPGLVMWLIKKDKSEFINKNGKNIINHIILMAIVYIISLPLILFCVGYITLFLGLVYSLVVLIMAAIKAKKGEVWKIPGFNFIKID